MGLVFDTITEYLIIKIMLKSLIENILISLSKDVNYFVSLHSIPTVVLNTVISGVTCLANSNTPYWVPSNWNPFLLQEI